MMLLNSWRLKWTAGPETARRIAAAMPSGPEEAANERVERKEQRGAGDHREGAQAGRPASEQLHSQRDSPVVEVGLANPARLEGKLRMEDFDRVQNRPRPSSPCMPVVQSPIR